MMRSAYRGRQNSISYSISKPMTRYQVDLRGQGDVRLTGQEIGRIMCQSRCHVQPDAEIEWLGRSRSGGYLLPLKAAIWRKNHFPSGERIERSKMNHTNIILLILLGRVSSHVGQVDIS